METVMAKLFATREEWLTMAIDEWNRRIFKGLDSDLDGFMVKVSCGFPPGMRGTKKPFAVLSSKYSTDGSREVFINPKFDAGPEVAGVVLDAMSKVTGDSLGAIEDYAIENNLGATYDVAGIVASELGDYPHAAINLAAIPKQSTRMHKAKCHQCGYTVRLTSKWLNVATPRCPVHDDMDMDVD
jgi:hypothetical protein